MVCNLDVSHDTHLTRADAALAEFGRACNTSLGRNRRILADHYIVRNLAEVVDSYAVLDDGGLHRSLVDGRVGADLHIVAYHHIADVLDFAPAAVRLRGIAEAVIADDAARVEYHPVPYHHPREDVHTRIDDAVGADFGPLAYRHIVVYLGAIAYLTILSDGHKITHRYPLAYLGAPRDAAAAAMAAVGLVVVCDIFQQIGEGRVGVLHPHESGGHRLLGLEISIHQQDGSPAGVGVLFVFWIGKETQLSRLAVFDFRK